MGAPVAGREELRAIARRAMVERGLLPDFSAAALAEASALADGFGEPAASLRDLRDRPWLSIDNDDSRDLDQLSLADPADGGAARLLVAIADVDAGVSAGSAIDTHARTNTTSVYTEAQVFPMLPERLSTDLTSLGENDERLALVVEMNVGADGSVGRSDVYRALVRNHAKLAYDSVAAWLEGTAAAPAAASAPEIQAQLRFQDGIAQAMKALRHRRGALTLGTTEAHVVFDGDRLADLRPDEKNRAKELIEDFMIAANVATAQFLEQRGFPSLRRVLRTPERWERIVELAHGLGEELPREANAQALQGFLARRLQADPLRFPDLSLAVVKLLGSGEYAVELPGAASDGHFGLAVKDYTHSTAPNRRFPDLATQRLLKAALAGRACPYTREQLAELAMHCTTQEDNASKVERQVRKSAAALLLAPRVGERFSGIVTGASPKGTWVRVLRPPVEGRVVRGEHGLDVGDRVTVELVDTNVERGFIDFARANGR
jgi:VacB/RNase II family 3'-5' exoribonuclease